MAKRIKFPLEMGNGVQVRTIEELRENFDIEKEGQVEIIGWMYQFYNIEPKAAVFSKKSGKITKEEALSMMSKKYDIEK